MIPERYAKYISVDGQGCWLWTGAVRSNGYGAARFRGKQHQAHRAVYTMVKGEIPAGLQLDHLCRVPRCVNPEHLEPVTGSENTRRGRSPEVTRAWKAAITHCPHGHEYTPGNTRICKQGKRHCRACRRARWYRTGH